MYEGYLALGGGEVLNSARSVGYTTTVDCPVNWLVCPPCDGIVDALGHNPYHYDNISEAPWYDAQDEPTHRFLGAHGISFEGIPDSTREAEVAEGILDGGVVGRVRNGTRRIRVRAMLSALGEDALEVGFSWLNSALTPGRCGLHGDACGAADARMYAACPPTREEVTTNLPVWNDPLTNLVPNPSFEAPGGPGAVVATNLATNPSFETSAGSTEVVTATNLATNPSFEQLAGTPGGGVSSIGQQFVMPTGAAGTMRIVDKGTAVEFWIACTDPVTTHPAFSWNGTVNGAPVGGTMPLPAGFGQRLLLSYPVPAVDGTPPIPVSWTIMPTGTQGLGGPTTQSVTLTRLTLGTPSTVEVRRNLHHWPRMNTGTHVGHWTAAEGGVTTTDTPTGVRVGGANGYPNWLHSVTDDPWTTGKGAILQGDTVVMSADFEVEAGWPELGIQIDMQAYAGTVPVGSEVIGTRVVVYAGQTIRIASAPITLPQGADQVKIMVRAGSGVETYFIVRNSLLEKTSVAKPYFDGYSPPVGDWSHAWAGAPDASASVENGSLVAGVQAMDGVLAISSTAWSSNRGRSLLTISNGSTNDRARVTVSGLTPGATYTAQVKMRLAAPFGTQGNERARTFWASPSGGIAVATPQAPAEAGVYPLSLEFVAGTGTIVDLDMYNGGSDIGQEVWWDDLMVIEGSYAGPYFDGYSPPQVRRNLFLDPNLATTGLRKEGGVVVTHGPVPGLDATIGAKAVTETANGGALLDARGSAPTFSSGETIYGAVKVYNPGPDPLVVTVWYRQYNPNIDGGHTTPDVTIPAGQTHQFTGSVVMAGTSTPTFNVRRSDTVPSYAGQEFWAFDPIWSLTPEVVPYFDGDSPVAPYGAGWEGAANASASYLYDDQYTYAWTGAPDASTSVKTRIVETPAGVAPPAADQATMELAEEGVHGAHALRFTVNKTGGVALPVIDFLPVSGVVYALVGKVRSRTRDLFVTPRIRNTNGPDVFAAKDVWTDFRLTTTAGTGTITQTGLLLGANAGHQVGDVIDIDQVMVVEGGYSGPYFDGATTDAAETYDWTGAPNASTSTKSVGATVSEIIPNNVVAEWSTEWVRTRTHSMKLIPYTGSNDTNAVVLGSDQALGPFVGGTTYTVVATVHLAAPLTGILNPAALGVQAVWNTQAGWSGAGSMVAQAPNVVGDHTLRLTFQVPSGADWALVRLYNGASGGGGDVWWDNVLVIEGAYEGPYFDGTFPDSPATDYEIPGTKLREFEWTGTPDDSTSTFRTGNVTEVEDPELYDEKLRRMVRNLHTVTCVAGPTVIQKYHRGDTWGYQVEFVLVAAVPWMYGDTRPVDLQPSIPIVIQDVPFNLVPYPSAELTDGVAVIAATNFSPNPSIEVNSTTWHAGTNAITPVGTGARTTELSAQGPASYKVTTTATNSGVDGAIYAIHDVPLPPEVPGQRFSVNTWVAGIVSEGTAVISQTQLNLEWRTAGDALVEVVTVGAGPAGGGPVTAKSLPRPAGASVARLVAIAQVASWSAGAVISVYADAATVSVP